VAAVALQPTPPSDRTRDGERTARKRAATMCQVGRFVFKVADLGAVDETPVIYWWDEAFRKAYREAPKLGEVAPARATQGLYNNTRFIRESHEVGLATIRRVPDSRGLIRWVPLTNGMDGAAWFEPLREVASWAAHGIDPKTYMATKTATDVYSYANEQFFFVPRGVAYATIGAEFSARMSRYPGIFANKGRSLFSGEPENLLCLLNSRLARRIASSLNPGVGFESGDVNRLPLFPVANADDIFATLDTAFTEHESHREPSVEFRAPGPSAWISAQAWAQTAVDRPESTPLAPFTPEHIAEPPTDHLSFALGVALGRFGAAGEGILDPATADLTHAAAGLLFLDGTLAPDRPRRRPSATPPPRRCTPPGPRTAPRSPPSATCARTSARRSSPTSTARCTRTGPSTGRSRRPTAPSSPGSTSTAWTPTPSACSWPTT
jgi:hypothetical protein